MDDTEDEFSYGVPYGDNEIFFGHLEDDNSEDEHDETETSYDSYTDSDASSNDDESETSNDEENDDDADEIIEMDIS